MNRASPEEVIKYQVSSSLWGWILSAYSEKGICALFLGEDPKKLQSELSERFPHAQLESTERVCDFDAEHELLGSYKGALDLRGTPFQLKVWHALKEIPFGHTVNYKYLAEQIGLPQAVRAVANACGANPLALAIPCHRVIRSNGQLSGYRWGTEIKKRLIEWERVHAKKK